MEPIAPKYFLLLTEDTLSATRYPMTVLELLQYAHERLLDHIPVPSQSVLADLITTLSVDPDRAEEIFSASFDDLVRSIAYAAFYRGWHLLTYVVPPPIEVPNDLSSE